MPSLLTMSIAATRMYRALADFSSTEMCDLRSFRSFRFSPCSLLSCFVIAPTSRTAAKDSFPPWQAIPPRPRQPSCPLSRSCLLPGHPTRRKRTYTWSSPRRGTRDYSRTVMSPRPSIWTDIRVDNRPDLAASMKISRSVLLRQDRSLTCDDTDAWNTLRR